NSRLLLDTIKPDPIAKRYEHLYTLVGADFARDQYNRLKGADPDLLTKEEDVWYDFMRNYVKNRLWKRIESVNQTSVDTAGKIINSTNEQAIAEGLGAYETATIIKKKLIEEGIKYNQWRALRIARTEIMTAANVGSFEGAKATGEALEKHWIATYDSRTRDTHKGIEAQNPKMMNEPFLVGAYQMQHPGDPAGGAEEVINCRCTIAYNVIGW
ncbi:phage minor head protein, partial [Mesotoga sp.]|uniref:phage minor head protein n=1 Tax=Mesotoga sp. TaxID=2053577 RepID=UPI00345E7E70